MGALAHVPVAEARASVGDLAGAARPSVRLLHVGHAAIGSGRHDGLARAREVPGPEDVEEQPPVADALGRDWTPRLRGRLESRELLREGWPRGERHVAPCRRPEIDVGADLCVDAGAARAREDVAVADE
eukprot:11349518-Alexandrium_andersonii.AAC.1